MADKAWKAYERRVAAMFHMKRALQKGTTEKADIVPNDGSECPYVIDAKKRKSLRIWSWMYKLVQYAQSKRKAPILVFQPWGKKQNFAVIRLRWFFKNFRRHVDCFSFESWSKPEKRDFQTAWNNAKMVASRENKIPGMFLEIVPDNIDYVCIKLENLISLMKTANMLGGVDNEE